jgi:hypothetical protein
MNAKLTTVQVAERLGVSHPTVKLWCRQGKFPHAELLETQRGPVWQIPEADLKDFSPPKRGRIPKHPADTTRDLNTAFRKATETSSPTPAKRAPGQASASNGTSTGKKKGGKK